LEAGWIVLLEAPEFVWQEMKRYRLDAYMHMGEAFAISSWRTLHPQQLVQTVEARLPKMLP
jgi:hypothetical protein